jgi:hypothetical protein
MLFMPPLVNSHMCIAVTPQSNQETTINRVIEGTCKVTRVIHSFESGPQASKTSPKLLLDSSGADRMYKLSSQIDDVPEGNSLRVTMRHCCCLKPRRGGWLGGSSRVSSDGGGIEQFPCSTLQRSYTHYTLAYARSTAYN